MPSGRESASTYQLTHTKPLFPRARADLFDSARELCAFLWFFSRLIALVPILILIFALRLYTHWWVYNTNKLLALNWWTRSRVIIRYSCTQAREQTAASFGGQLKHLRRRRFQVLLAHYTSDLHHVRKSRGVLSQNLADFFLLRIYCTSEPSDQLFASPRKNRLFRESNLFRKPLECSSMSLSLLFLLPLFVFASHYLWLVRLSRFLYNSIPLDLCRSRRSQQGTNLFAVHYDNGFHRVTDARELFELIIQVVSPDIHFRFVSYYAEYTLRKHE